MQSTELTSPSMTPQLASRVWRDPNATAAEKKQAALVMHDAKAKKARKPTAPCAWAAWWASLPDRITEWERELDAEEGRG